MSRQAGSKAWAHDSKQRFADGHAKPPSTIPRMSDRLSALEPTGDEMRELTRLATDRIV